MKDRTGILGLALIAICGISLFIACLAPTSTFQTVCAGIGALSFLGLAALITIAQ